ncbi:MAG: T9SS type A sorting domain-containing protein [Melioribacteraceae bacterium]
MKKSLLVLFLFLAVGANFAQTIFVEDFNYNPGDLLTAKGWTLSSGTTNQIATTSPGLTFTGYPSVAGNAITLTKTGEDVYNTFPAVSSGSIYLAFLMNVQSAQTGDYFIALSPQYFVNSSGVQSSGQTNYYARTHLRSNGTGFSIGISKSSELSGGYVYGNTVLSYNTTYVVVIKHTFNASTTDDDAESIYVFGTAIPTTEPTTPEVGPHIYSAKTDPVDLYHITLRQGTTSASASMILDGVRIASSWTSLFTTTDVVVNTIPSKYALNQNYPNPFNPSTIINYQLPEAGQVTLKVYDVLGNEVSTLVNEFKQAGVYNAKFSNSQLSSGIYFYKLQVGNFVSVKKMMLAK